MNDRAPARCHSPLACYSLACYSLACSSLRAAPRTCALPSSRWIRHAAAPPPRAPQISGRHYETDEGKVHIECWAEYHAAVAGAPAEPFSLGWFYKKGQLRQSWRRRVAEVTNGHLFYFDSPSTSVPRGAVPLAGATLTARTFTKAELPGASRHASGAAGDTAGFELRATLDVTTKSSQRTERVLLFYPDEAAHAASGAAGTAADLWRALLPPAIGRASEAARAAAAARDEQSGSSSSEQQPPVDVTEAAPPGSPVSPSPRALGRVSVVGAALVAPCSPHVGTKATPAAAAPVAAATMPAAAASRAVAGLSIAPATATSDYAGARPRKRSSFAQQGRARAISTLRFGRDRAASIEELSEGEGDGCDDGGAPSQTEATDATPAHALGGRLRAPTLVEAAPPNSTVMPERGSNYRISFCADAPPLITTATRYQSRLERARAVNVAKRGPSFVRRPG